MNASTLRPAHSVLTCSIFSVSMLSIGLISGAAFAQLPQTRLNSVFPPGAQKGSTVDVRISGGTDLDEVVQLIFSHKGITAARKLDAAGNPVAGTFVVTVDGSVPAGLYDARVLGLFGVSNPRIFRVDTLPEMIESEPNNSPEQATVVMLNSVVNAQVAGAADLDFFRFRVDAGQTVVIRSEAARLDSAMQPFLQLYDKRGRRVSESRRVFSQEADLVFTSDSAQELTLKVSDVVFAGGADFVYRLSIDTRPLVDFVLPTVISRSQPTSVEIYGRYLPDGQASPLKLDGRELQRRTVEVPAADSLEAGTGFASYSAPVDAGWWNGIDGNLIPLSVSDQPVVIEAEGDADQVIAVPTEVVGNLATIADDDGFRFEAKKGESWVVDVFAHRLGSVADPLLYVEQVIKAADGSESFKRLAAEDDDKQNPGGDDLPTLSADPSFQLNVPEDGVYRVRIRDRYGDSRGDPRLTYQISIRRPAPDFRLVVFDAFQSADGKAPATTGAVSLRKGGSYELTVYAYRRDGFNDAIRLGVSELPDGVTCSPSVIGPGQASAKLVFTASEAASEIAASVVISGHGGAADAAMVRRAQVATLVHDAVNGLPRTARMSESLVVGVMKDEQPFSVVIEPAIMATSQDQQVLIPVTVQRRNGFDDKVDLAFLGVPANVDAPALSIDKGSNSATARLFIKENAPVSTSTIVLSATAAVPYRRNPWIAERASQKVMDAETLLSTRQQMAAATATALANAMRSLTETNERIAALMKDMSDLAAKQQAIRDQYSTAFAEHQKLVDELVQVKQTLAAAEASKDGSSADYEKALKAIVEGAAAAESAGSRITELSSKVKQHADALKSVMLEEQKKAAEKASVEERLPGLKKAADEADAAVKAAQQVVEQAKAAKAAAEEASKKANDATKPANVNVRVVSPAIVLQIHPAPGKLTAQAADSGALKKGGSLAVKVTVARKNNFAGPFQVSLVTPEGVTGISAPEVLIAADQTEASLVITADAAATAGDIANAVVRATGDFTGRAASVDVPVAIKVVD